MSQNHELLMHNLGDMNFQMLTDILIRSGIEEDKIPELLHRNIVEMARDAFMGFLNSEITLNSFEIELMWLKSLAKSTRA